jgi:hypothetical protein
MSSRKAYKSNFVIGSIVTSKKGASLLVERLQLTPAGVSALTTTASSIGNGNQQAVQQPTKADNQKHTDKGATTKK